MKYSNRRKYRDQTVEIVEEVVLKKKTTKKTKVVKKIKSLWNKVLGWFKK